MSNADMWPALLEAARLLRMRKGLSISECKLLDRIDVIAKDIGHKEIGNERGAKS